MDVSLPQLPRRSSLVSETVRTLRDALRAGLWIDRLPGERALCARLQVSRPTVRAALEELRREGWIEVDARKRRRILALDEASASNPVLRSIAILAPRPLLLMPPTAVVMVDELRTDLARAGFELELVVNPAAFSEKPERALESLVSRHRSGAWIAFGSREPMQRWFLRKGLPCLVAGSCAPGIALPSIDLDYLAICRHAGGTFLAKGRRRIALCLPESVTGGETDSETGLREALRRTEDAKLLVLKHDGTAAHLCALLDKAFASVSPPNAVLVARAVHLLTVVTYLQRRGLRIPADVAVISRDDEPFLRHVVPSPAHYAVAPSRFTRQLSRAARQLAETGSLPPKATRLVPRFVPGETV